MDMVLDINSDIYPVKVQKHTECPPLHWLLMRWSRETLGMRPVQVGSKYKLMLASTLNSDGSASPNHFDGVRPFS